MARMTQVTMLEMAEREALLLGCQDGATLECLAGEVWVTQDGRREDWILGAGGRLGIEGRAPVVVSANRDARVAVRRPEGRLAGIAGASGRFAARLCGWPRFALAALPGALVHRRRGRQAAMRGRMNPPSTATARTRSNSSSSQSASSAAGLPRMRAPTSRKKGTLSR